MLRRSITLTVWALLAWMVVALALRLGGSGAAVNAPDASPALAASPSLARLFGAAAPAAPEALPPSDGRIRLLGLVAPGDARLQGAQGIALLSVDGGPPKSFRVGDQVDGALRLLRVTARSAGFGEGDAVSLELPLDNAPSAAATGSLPPAAPMLNPTAPPPAAQPLQAVEPPPGLPLRRDPGPAEAPRSPTDTASDDGPRRPTTLPNR